MKKLNLDSLSVQDMNTAEMKKIYGGNPIIIFILGAIGGGAIYDVYKAGAKAYLKADHPTPDGSYPCQSHGR